MRIGLKIVLVVLSLIPLYFGITGFFGGAAAVQGEAVSSTLDNQYRYWAGYYLSLAFMMWYVLGDLDSRGTVLRLMILAVFLGGLGRLYNVIEFGPANTMQMGAMFLELGAPLIALWHSFVTKGRPA